jgi:signal transduction histidine kinase
VEDNGVGISEEVVGKLFRLDKKHSSKGTANEKGTGLGLILCQEFIEKNGGKLSVKSRPGKGSVFSFSFPAAVQARVPMVQKEPMSF